MQIHPYFDRFLRTTTGTLALALFFVLAASRPASATPVTFFGIGFNTEDPTNPTWLKAQATFDVTTGGLLVITLSNISGGDVLRRSDVLTGLFFDVASGITLTPVSAVVAAGSVVVNNTSVTNVGGEWGYETSLDGDTPEEFVGTPGGAQHGIGAAAFGDLFNAPNFSGSNLGGNVNVNGYDYGLTSQGDNPSTGTKDVMGSAPLIDFSVIFTLSGIPMGFDPSAAISNVSFQYGSDISEPNLDGFLPEPGTLLLVGAGLALAAFRKRSRASVR